jgi:hypothetical protein
MVIVNSIPWQPIDEANRDHKDGREVLLWADDVGQAEFGRREGKLWVSRDGATLHGVSYFAEINTPN